MTRRTLVGCLGALASRTVAGAVETNSNIRIGAIRWDAWYGSNAPPGSSEAVARHNLDPEKFQNRAPFFARKTGNKLEIEGKREDVDAEINFASRAGIDYWVFGWYSPERLMHKGWVFYQESQYRNLVKWCILIGINSLALDFPGHADLVTYFKQENYERLGGRPLLFILHEDADLKKAAARLLRLRQICEEGACGNPYVVIMSGDASLSMFEAHAIGADAISSYCTPLFNVASYSDLARAAEETWRKQAETGMPVIPTAMTGWDRRPRAACAGSLENTRSSLCVRDDSFVTRGTAQEISRHIEKLLEFISKGSKGNSNNHGLIYSWNENDEGGDTLMPMYGTDGKRIIDAVGRVLIKRK